MNFFIESLVDQQQHNILKRMKIQITFHQNETIPEIIENLFNNDYNFGRLDSVSLF